MKYEKHDLRSTIWKEKEREEKLLGRKHVFLRLDSASRQRFLILSAWICNLLCRQENNIQEWTLDNRTTSTALHFHFFLFKFFPTKNEHCEQFFVFVIFFLLAVIFTTQNLSLSDVQSFYKKTHYFSFIAANELFLLKINFDENFSAMQWFFKNM